MSGMAGMAMTGVALGAGSEVGHQAVRAMMGSGSGGSGGGAAPEGGQGAPPQAPAQGGYAQPPAGYASEAPPEEYKEFTDGAQ